VHSTAEANVQVRAVGRLDALEKTLAGYTGPSLNGVGIGHTRWATHGAVTLDNAHPHTDCAGRISIVHNGIIDNAAELRRELRGHVFRSEVDSEVIAHLVELYRSPDIPLREAVRRAVGRLSGSWAIAVLAEGDDHIVVTAHGSPLVVANSCVGRFAASDLSAIIDWVEEFRVLGDGDIVELGDTARWLDANGARVERDVVRAGWRGGDVELGEHPDFMHKEIAEQPEMASRILELLRPGIATGGLWHDRGLPTVHRIRIVGCGTSLHAGMAIGQVFRTAGIPARLTIASEAGEDVPESGELVIAMSQSGETADVLRALEKTDAPILAITNTAHSTLARRADAVLECHAGPEIGVAATKTFTAQVLAGVCIALSGLVDAGQLSSDTVRQLVDQLDRIPDLLSAADSTAAQMAELCPTLTDAVGFLFVARGGGLPYAAEGALKLKEITYRWAQCYPAGELKHGPIALIEAGTPVVVIDDGDYRLAGNIAEMQARGARIIRIGDSDSPAPWGPLPVVVQLQHLARGIARHLGRDVDKPRNLAKSVTVE
jgi:glucosamine--fructose-6-phosphate aminotransferase (isomerizing)